MHVKLVNLDKKDPSELGFNETWKCIETGESTSLKGYISERLQLI